jgi:hypothetical protein
MLNEDGSRSRSHGLRPEILAHQATAIGVPLLTGCATWQSYDAEFQALLRKATRWGISHVIFGDIFPEAHKHGVGNFSRAFSNEGMRSRGERDFTGTEERSTAHQLIGNRISGVSAVVTLSDGFERLAHYFKNIAREFGQFVEEQHSVV